MAKKRLERALPAPFDETVCRVSLGFSLFGGGHLPTVSARRRAERRVYRQAVRTSPGETSKRRPRHDPQDRRRAPAAVAFWWKDDTLDGCGSIADGGRRVVASERSRSGAAFF